MASLTLGGYDKHRFVPHDTKFPLDPVTRLPTVRLRGITAQVPSMDKAPTSNWTSTARPLLAMEDAIIAVVDSSTPYLWLPTEVCDRFAAALDLTWRDDLGVYVFSKGSQYTGYQSDTSLSFTFSLSSYHNADNFGRPFDTPGVVNITLPASAFAQLLRYPFKNVIRWGDSSIPYFPLKRSTKEGNNNQYIIGRVFMQEAYIVTSYDRSTFSLHQALFPGNAKTNYSLEAITRPADSPYPALGGDPAAGHGLNTGQTAGIALSAFITGGILGLILWCCCKRRRRAKRNEPPGQDENKDGAQAEEEEVPKSPVVRMFTMIMGKRKSRKSVVRGADGSSSRPVEVGADAQHEVFEMLAPPEPAELDSHDVDDEETDFEVDSTQGLSQYEIIRRKLDRQLQGPVPAYTPTVLTFPELRQEKSMQDMSPVAHYRAPDEPSPVSSPTYANSNSIPGSLPSPMTPHGDWPSRTFDPPSPVTVAPSPQLLQAPSNGFDSGSSYSPISPRPIHSPQSFVPSPITCSDSDASPTSPTGSVQLPSPTFQRTPIEPSRVICLGPLPENVRLPLPQPLIPRIVIPDGRSVETGVADPDTTELPLPLSVGHQRSLTQSSSDTLGSNFTVEEEDQTQMADAVRHHNMLQIQHEQGDADDMPRSPRSMERIEGGSELIHVPQVADKRYSWEDVQDRI